MSAGKRITIDLDDVEAAAFEMIKADCARHDPLLDNDSVLAKSMVLGILEDDLAAHSRPVLVN